LWSSAGSRFIINTNKGPLSVRANKTLKAGYHYIARVYDGERIKLFIDGKPVNERKMKAVIQTNDVCIKIGKISNGQVYFKGTVNDIRISNIPKSSEQIKAEYDNFRLTYGCPEKSG
jgi:hypothetical protein